MTDINKKPKYRHGDIPDMRVTTIDNVAEEQAEKYKKQLEELRKRGLVIALKDGAEFALVGYTTAKDHAEEPIFHFKVKPDDRLFLYHMTQHPEAKELYDKAVIWCLMHGYTMRSAADECEKMYELVNAGKHKEMAEGIHPEMDYIKEDGTIPLE